LESTTRITLQDKGKTTVLTGKNGRKRNRSLLIDGKRQEYKILPNN
jgi:hypothetical protein